MSFRLRHLWNLATVSLAISLANALPAGAQQINIELHKDLIDRDHAEQAILKALKKPVTVDCLEEPLSEVVKDLSAQAGVNIVLDIRAFDFESVGPESQITRHLDNVSLRSALKLMLHDLKLTYTIRNEVLLITTKEEARATLITRVYEVGDLVTLQSSHGSLVYPARWQKLPGELYVDFDSLIETIMIAVAPNSWSNTGGGAGHIAGFEYSDKRILIITQTATALEAIEGLFEKLRSIRPLETSPKQARGAAPKKRPIISRVYRITGPLADSVEELTELLRAATGEEVWNARKDSLLMGRANAILVRHDVSVQKQVTRLLNEMNAISGRGSSLTGSGGIFSVDPSTAPLNE